MTSAPPPLATPRGAPAHSIRRTLLVWLLAGLLGIGVLASGATYLAARNEAGALLDQQLRQLAYSTRIDDLVRGRQPDFTLRGDTPGLGVTEIVTQIWDRDGVLVYWSQPGMGLPVPATEGYSTVHHDGRDWRVYTLVHGRHALQVAQSQDQRDAAATQTALRTLAPFVAFIPLFGLLIWVAVSRGLAPLATMSQAVAKRRPDAMAPLAERGLPEELQPLAANLNALLARLDAALEAQRRFTADAAHELRTPLTALKLQLDMARRAADGPDLDSAHADLEAGVARASHLVDQLLTLARVEPEALAAGAVECDLLDIAREAIVARAPLAAAKDIDLGIARGVPARVRGDAPSLAILMSNLIDNALRYTPAHGRVDVSVDTEGSQAVLTVADTGPGIPAVERERVFDRFYRSSEAAAAGSGLGLSIVRRIADAHQASISLDSPADHSGLVVTVRLPLAA